MIIYLLVFFSLENSFSAEEKRFNAKKCRYFRKDHRDLKICPGMALQISYRNRKKNDRTVCQVKVSHTGEISGEKLVKESKILEESIDHHRLQDIKSHSRVPYIESNHLTTCIRNGRKKAFYKKNTKLALIEPEIITEKSLENDSANEPSLAGKLFQNDALLNAVFSDYLEKRLNKITVTLAPKGTGAFYDANSNTLTVEEDPNLYHVFDNILFESNNALLSGQYKEIDSSFYYGKINFNTYGIRKTLAENEATYNYVLDILFLKKQYNLPLTQLGEKSLSFYKKNGLDPESGKVEISQEIKEKFLNTPHNPYSRDSKLNLTSAELYAYEKLEVEGSKAFSRTVKAAVQGKMIGQMLESPPGFNQYINMIEATYKKNKKESYPYLYAFFLTQIRKRFPQRNYLLDASFDLTPRMLKEAEKYKVNLP